MPRIYSYKKPKRKISVGLDFNKWADQKAKKKALETDAARQATQDALAERRVQVSEGQLDQSKAALKYKQEAAGADKAWKRWERGRDMAKESREVADRIKDAKTDAEKAAAELDKEILDAPVYTYGFLRGNKPKKALERFNVGREGNMKATNVFLDEENEMLTAVVPGAEHGKEHIPYSKLAEHREIFSDTGLRGVGSKGKSSSDKPSKFDEGAALARFRELFAGMGKKGVMSASTSSAVTSGLKDHTPQQVGQALQLPENTAAVDSKTEALTKYEKGLEENRTGALGNYVSQVWRGIKNPSQMLSGKGIGDPRRSPAVSNMERQAVGTQWDIAQMKGQREAQMQGGQQKLQVLRKDLDDVTKTLKAKINLATGQPLDTTDQDDLRQIIKFLKEDIAELRSTLQGAGSGVLQLR